MKPDQTLHLLIRYGDSLPETHLGVADRPDRHPYAGAASFVPKQGKILPEKTAVLFGEVEWVWPKAGGSGVLFLLLNGGPIRETIAWNCPIVMNTREELSRAFQDLLEDTLIH